MISGQIPVLWPAWSFIDANIYMVRYRYYGLPAHVPMIWYAYAMFIHVQYTGMQIKN
jgi:hypothetical protein